MVEIEMATLRESIDALGSDVRTLTGAVRALVSEMQGAPTDETPRALSIGEQLEGQRQLKIAARLRRA